MRRPMHECLMGYAHFASQVVVLALSSVVAVLGSANTRISISILPLYLDQCDLHRPQARPHCQLPCQSSPPSGHGVPAHLSQQAQDTCTPCRCSRTPCKSCSPHC